MNNSSIRTGACCLLMLLCASSWGDVPKVPKDKISLGEKQALRFWKALAEADFKTMSECYAATVLLKGGSEFLKPEWEISPHNDRSRDAEVDRQALMQGYLKLMDKVGVDKWKATFAKVPQEQISMKLCQKDGEPFPGVKQGDWTLAIDLKNDFLVFVLRKDEANDWYVVAEKTDY